MGASAFPRWSWRKTSVKQVEERIGTKMLASFRCRGGHSNPRHDLIQVCNRSNERCIVAFMFTKSQLEGWRGYWDLSTSGNCCCPESYHSGNLGFGTLTRHSRRL